MITSPFDYKNNVLFVAPQDIPEPNDNDYNTSLNSFLKNTLEITNGSSFVLFTSYSQLKKSYEEELRKLAPDLRLGNSDFADLLLIKEFEKFAVVNVLNFLRPEPDLKRRHDQKRENKITKVEPKFVVHPPVFFQRIRKQYIAMSSRFHQALVTLYLPGIFRKHQAGATGTFWRAMASRRHLYSQVGI